MVLITGGSRGIGLGIAEKFLAQGHPVAINCKEDTQQLAHALTTLNAQYNNKAHGFVADITDYQKAQHMVQHIQHCHGPIHTLVNNAGVAHFGLFTHTPMAEISQILSSNLHSAMHMAHLVAPAMVREKKGNIINISSIWGVTGASCEVAYSAAKAGLIGFTKALAKELGPSHVRVNAIACGAIHTRMNQRLLPEEEAQLTEAIPLGRFGLPTEVGDLAVFLASEQAAYLTGQAIVLDGGMI